MNTHEYERFLESTPPFQLPPSALEQPVGWSSKEQRPISLREFIATRAPGTGTALLQPDGQGVTEPPKRVTELTDEELTETVVALLRQTPKNIRFAIRDHGDFSTDDFIEHVKVRTELGLRLTAAAKGHIDMLEQLIEAGKLTILESGQPSTKLPDFEF